MKNATNPARIGQIATSGVFALFLAALFIANLLYSPPEISLSERRRLQQLPAIWTDGSDGRELNSDFMDEFEQYALDSFPWRDGFRRLKSMVLFNVLRQKDNNGIYVKDGYAAAIEALDEASAGQLAGKIDTVINSLLVDRDLNLYYSIIPDKGYYLSEGGYPGVDYGRLEEIFAGTLDGNAQYIDIKGALDISSYYKTDLHWDQAGLAGVVNALGGAMGFAPSLDGFETNTLEPFYGVYYGQSALPLPHETLTYLTGGAIDSARVYLLDAVTGELAESAMYLPEKFDGVDPYDVFLSGVQPLVVIENPETTTDRELYIFRDSFGSSLAPLLTGEYAKITLIDLRYMAAAALPQFVEFKDGSDVLFIYGMQIINSSGTIMVK